LSTLTGAIVVALGKKHAGLFTNSDELSTKLIQTGDNISEKLWRMPVDTYHHDMIKPKTADLTNSPGKGDAGSSQAAAFL
jgi:leucyl aminopeptidase